MSEVAMSHDQRIALYRAQIERDANFTACHDVIGRLVNAMVVIDQLQALVRELESQLAESRAANSGPPPGTPTTTAFGHRPIDTL